MNNLRNGLCGTALVLAAAVLGGCASSAATTGEPGVSMGDSYQKVLAVVSRNNTVTKQIDGQGFRQRVIRRCSRTAAPSTSCSRAPMGCSV